MARFNHIGLVGPADGGSVYGRSFNSSLGLGYFGVEFCCMVVGVATAGLAAVCHMVTVIDGDREFETFETDCPSSGRLLGTT